MLAVLRPVLAIPDLLGLVVRSHPSAAFGGWRERRAFEASARSIDALPPHLRDDLGLDPVPPVPPRPVFAGRG